MTRPIPLTTVRLGTVSRRVALDLGCDGNHGLDHVHAGDPMGYLGARVGRDLLADDFHPSFTPCLEPRASWIDEPDLPSDCALRLPDGRILDTDAIGTTGHGYAVFGDLAEWEETLLDHARQDADADLGDYLASHRGDG